jgi:hypothetical protein
MSRWNNDLQSVLNCCNKENSADRQLVHRWKSLHAGQRTFAVGGVPSDGFRLIVGRKGISQL